MWLFNYSLSITIQTVIINKIASKYLYLFVLILRSLSSFLYTIVFDNDISVFGSLL